MTPTSSAQLAAATDGTAVPPPERVRERLWAVPVPMPPGQRGLAYSLCYLLQDDDGRVHVVDPGWDSSGNRDALRDALAALVPGAPVASVVVTHLHPDHLGMAEHLRAETGAPVVLHEREAAAMVRLGEDDPGALDRWGVPDDRRPELAALREGRPVFRPVRPNLVLRGDEDRLDVPGWDVRVLRTPGHTPGSVCLRLPDERAILTGDHVLPAIFPGLGLGGATAGNPVADYLAALERIAAFDDHEVLPGHGYRFTGLAERCGELADHHRRRTAEVAQALESDPGASVWQVAARLTWSAGWPNMRGFFLLSALSQTALHIDLITRYHEEQP